MEYTEGYLAFLDILGFSKFVEDEKNGQATADLFKFVEWFSDFFNKDSKHKVNVSFFSDTIIITSEEFQGLNMPIFLAEHYLRNNLGLLFRGSVVYGKYYHENGTTFGPAIVSAYKLEKAAVYSRILIDKSVKLTKGDAVLYFKDLDGYMCYNPYVVSLFNIVTQKKSQPEDTGKEIIKHFINHREELLHKINAYKGDPVVNKYLWRARIYNYTCKLVVELPIKHLNYKDISYDLDEETRKKILELVIPEIDLIDLYRFVDNT